ncbi:hypothetical protein LIA77_02427 [Sarocladium implicatum]|jgi:hypothetical protein|nr:hypothetical protein LIA77_02427 [Sarocladium implicatum]
MSPLVYCRVADYLLTFSQTSFLKLHPHQGMSPLLGIVSPTDLAQLSEENHARLARNFLYPRDATLLSDFSREKWQRNTVGKSG